MYVHIPSTTPQLMVKKLFRHPEAPRLFLFHVCILSPLEWTNHCCDFPRHRCFICSRPSCEYNHTLCVFFSISLSSLKFSHILCVIILFLLCFTVSLYINIVQFVYHSVDGYLGSWTVFGIMNKAMNTLVCDFFCEFKYSFLLDMHIGVEWPYHRV